ncbi:MAG: DNA polymerase III subunit beta [Actinomycetes bacterium]
MKFRVERDVLADAVSWAARTLPTRPSMPVLAGLVLEASDDSVTLSSFDYEVSSRVTIAADVQTPGTSLVSGRLLADITRSLPGAPVQLSNEGTRVVITCGRSSFTLPTLPVEDYPSLPAMPDSSGDIEAALFASAVAQVAVAAGRDDTLPTLTGIRMEIEGGNIVLAATDRYRLAVREFSWNPKSSSISVNALIPAKTLADTAKSLSTTDLVTIALSAGGSGEGLIGFEGAGRRTTTRLLDGEFPKYRTLLPSEAATVASVDTAALADAVKRVALVAERNTPVRLAFDGSEVVLRAGTGDDAQANEVVECRVDGDGLEIAFNPTYLLDGLSAVAAVTTAFSFTQATRPAVLTGADTNATSGVDDYRYLLMPVRLTG